MKLLIRFLFLFFSCVGLNAVAAEPMNNTQNSDLTQTEQPSLRAGELVEILMTINKNEVNAAKLALEKTTNPKVKKFAQHMEMDHSKNLMATKAIADELNIQPVPTPLSNTLHEKGKKGLDKLKEMNGKAFDLAYMKEMVTGHQAALEIISKKLIPNAKNPKVEQHLQMTKTTVEQHLELAESTLNSLSHQKY